MHNGQIGGFERIRRRLEASLPDAPYAERVGTTDSELFFLLALDEGLESDPQGPVSRTVARVEDVSRRAGFMPDVKLTAAFSDEETLWAVRHASDGVAPTLYTAATKENERCLVSEPFDRKGCDWQTVPPESFVAIGKGGMRLRPILPARARLARIA